MATDRIWLAFSSDSWALLCIICWLLFTSQSFCFNCYVKGISRFGISWSALSYGKGQRSPCVNKRNSC